MPSIEPGDRDSRAVGDVKGKAVRGALFSISSQMVSLCLRMASMVVMARLLMPEDFGVVAMVTAFTGVLSLFRDCGLSMATVQRERITHEQTSTLLWINVTVGVLLATMTGAAGPMLAVFYREPRVTWIAAALGVGFVFSAIGAQHHAALQRDMRFGRLALVDLLSLCIGIALAITSALAGAGYWALVMMATIPTALGSIGLWLASGWVPGLPCRGAGIKPLLAFGGTVTLNNLVVYLAYNADKVLLGRFWGAEALGLYSRAYQLINLPTENLNAAIGSVAFSAIAGLQGYPVRLKRYFLAGYRLFLSLVITIPVGCALFADDIVRVFLGPRWEGAAAVFRLLAPTAMVFGIINPFGWFMQATGQAVRSLRIAFLIAPVVVVAYFLGIAGGPSGVAVAFSIATSVLALPVIVWAKRDTLISVLDLAVAMMPPVVSVVLSTVVVVLSLRGVGRIQSVVPRLAIELGLLLAVHWTILLFGLGQWKVYSKLLRETRLWPKPIAQPTA